MVSELAAASSLDGAEHLHFACNGCGDCCRRLRVALTHRALERLIGAVHVPATSLVAWLSPDEVDPSEDAANFALLPGGPRLMVLAQLLTYRLDVPQVRGCEPYHPSLFGKWQRSERALLVACAEM